jgi:hypothetical protein
MTAKVKGRTSFCEQKEAKKHCYAGPGARRGQCPWQSIAEKLCVAFYKKRLFASLISHHNALEGFFLIDPFF